MGMKCDCRADISSKVGEEWREGRGGDVRGRGFREESVGGFGCGKGVGFEGGEGEMLSVILSVILSQCRELSMDSQIVRKFTLFSFNAPRHGSPVFPDLFGAV